MKRTDRAGATAYLTSWAQGEGVHSAVRGDRAYFASPVERLDQVLAATGAGGAPGRRKAGSALSVVLDLLKLAQSVRVLPESVWGLGGFAMKGTAVRWLDAVDDLKSLTLEVSSKGQAVEARLTLLLAPADPSRAPRPRWWASRIGGSSRASPFHCRSLKGSTARATPTPRPSPP